MALAETALFHVPFGSSRLAIKVETPLGLHQRLTSRIKDFFDRFGRNILRHAASFACVRAVELVDINLKFVPAIMRESRGKCLWLLHPEFVA